MPDTVGSEQREPTSLRGIASGGRWYVRFAEASATEEPGAGKLHAGDCAGAARKGGSYRGVTPATPNLLIRKPFFEQYSGLFSVPELPMKLGRLQYIARRIVTVRQCFVY